MDDDEVSIVEHSVPLIDRCAQIVDNVAVNEDACACSFLESIARKYSGKTNRTLLERANKRNKMTILRQRHLLVGKKSKPRGRQKIVTRK